ncbi:MAG: aldehyde ferredoxin oxidoreductase family protein [Oscillospiraceae bacterium]|nr:aldehyde ferredoxin oxidoreductase family protein [Oscillospiraceae bacterium]
MYAYTGKILYVDLSTGRHKIGTFDEDFAKNYIGGTGFGVKTLIDNSKPGLDPFDPENPLIYVTGATTGTLVPCTASKFGVFAKSPATNLLGEAYSTGQFGADLRMAGYDIVVITGRSTKPVYLFIDDDSIQLKNASKLWGKSTWDTEQGIRDELGDQNVRVSAIGPAGENRVRLACLINDHFRAAGRTGLGAVMGSKNLKAVAVRGTNDVAVAEPVELENFCMDLYTRAKGPATAKYRGLGTTANMLTMNAQGCLPTRNYQAATFEGIEKISGERVNELNVQNIQACSACPCRCEHIAEVKEGKYKGAIGRVEYEPMMAFGSYCCVDDLNSMIKALEYCDEYGVDAIGTGIVIGFAMECYEKGLITKEDTGGLELNFGNGDAIVEMVRKIALREDIGDLMAEGVKRASEKIGKGSEHFAMHIKGLEMTGYDVRGLKTCALGYAVSRRGADHQRHGSYGWDLSGKADRYTADSTRGKLVMGDEDLYAVVDSMIICKFTRTIWKVYDDIAKVYSQVTGIPMTAEDMRKDGERINNLARIYNIREGMTRKDDNLPPRVMKDPIPEGVSKGNVVTQEDLDIMLDSYYEARGWDKMGVPTESKLEELGLGSYADILKADKE